MIIKILTMLIVLITSIFRVNATEYYEDYYYYYNTLPVDEKTPVKDYKIQYVEINITPEANGDVKIKERWDVSGTDGIFYRNSYKSNKEGLSYFDSIIEVEAYINSNKCKILKEKPNKEYTEKYMTYIYDTSEENIYNEFIWYTESDKQETIVYELEYTLKNALALDKDTIKFSLSRYAKGYTEEVNKIVINIHKNGLLTAHGTNVNILNIEGFDIEDCADYFSIKVNNNGKELDSLTIQLNIDKDTFKTDEIREIDTEEDMNSFLKNGNYIILSIIITTILIIAWCIKMNSN